MRRRLLGAVLPVLLLAGCTSTVALQPAPDATSVGCAGVIARTRQIPAIATADQRITDAQGTAAWGTPASATLTCGVVVPAFSAADCAPYGGVDWLTQNRTTSAGGRVVLTSYGRTPAVQIVVDPVSLSVSDVLMALSEPVADATAQNGRRCLAPTDVATPSATPTPTP